MDPQKFLLIAILAVAVLLLTYSYRENFFFGAGAVNVTWTAPSYNNPNLLYSWKVCQTGPTAPACAGTDPTKWPGKIQTTTDTSCVLDDTTCPGCDFGNKLLFAVMDTDPNTNLSSGWATTTIDLTGNVQGSEGIIDSQTGESLAVGSTNFEVSLTLKQNVFGASTTAELIMKVQRGSTVFELQKPVKFLPTVTTGVVYFDGTFTDVALWGATPPGRLQGGDVVSYQSLVIATAENGPVYYYGGGSIAVKAAAPPHQILADGKFKGCSFLFVLNRWRRTSGLE